MQHVRIGEQDAGFPAQAAPRPTRRVAIVGAKAFLIQPLSRQLAQPAQLVVGQCLGGEQVQGAGTWIGQQGFEDRHVVGQRLAAGGPGGQDHVLPRARGIDGLCLVAVELAGANVPQRCLQARWKGPVQLAIPCPPGPDPLHVYNLPPVAGQPVDLFDKGGCVHRGGIVPRKMLSLKCSTTSFPLP